MTQCLYGLFVPVWQQPSLAICPEEEGLHSYANGHFFGIAEQIITLAEILFISIVPRHYYTC